MRLLGLTTICALAFVMPTVAHHSHGNYTDGTIDIEGVVKEVVLVVPHSYVYIDVKKDGATETWVLEATSPGNLMRAGWTRTAIKVGDRVSVVVAPLRDGTHGGWCRGVTLLDSGRKLEC